MATRSNGHDYDCIIIGGGPAGLTAAVYLSRYRRNVVVFDDGHSRARLIPTSHNYPGFSGIHGTDLLHTLRKQARHYGAQIDHRHVDALEHAPDGTFVARIGSDALRASRVLLATGIVDESPKIPGFKDAVYHGALRFCPICDGYEAMDRRIGILGRLDVAWHKALFLRTYSRKVAVLPIDGTGSATDEMRRALHEADIPFPIEAVADIEHTGDTITAVFESGARFEVDVLYPALGCEVRSNLGTALGARATAEGTLIVDDHRRTSVAGLYAAGDVVSDLHQISVATGHAAVASTAIHNGLPRNFR
jgi:thioredoxin reductase (NADPH)